MAFVKISEQPSLYDDLEKKSIHELLVDINTEDKKVALAVEKALPQMEDLVTRIVPRMKKGGRVFYMGAGTSGRLGVLDASELPPTFGVPSTYVYGLIAGGDYALRNAVENAEDDTKRGWEELKEFDINENDTVIGIAASGTSKNSGERSTLRASRITFCQNLLKSLGMGVKERISSGEYATFTRSR